MSDLRANPMKKRFIKFDSDQSYFSFCDYISERLWFDSEFPLDQLCGISEMMRDTGIVQLHCTQNAFECIKESQTRFHFHIMPTLVYAQKDWY